MKKTGGIIVKVINNKDINEWVAIQYEIGLNPMPWDTRTKDPYPVLPEYKIYRENGPTRADLDEWIEKKYFEQYGVAQQTGLCHRGKFRGTFLNCLDIDNEEMMNKLLKIIKELLKISSLEELTKHGIFIEQHPDDLTRAHLWMWSEKPFPAIKRDGLEVKSNGMLCNMFPSFHVSGQQYTPIGDSLKILDSDGKADLNDGFVKIIDKMLNGEYLNGKAGKNTTRTKISIGEKWKKGTRANKLLSYGNSVYYHLLRTNPSTPTHIIDKVIELVNPEWCEEPKEPFKIKSICQSAREFQLKNYNPTTQVSGTLSVSQAKRQYLGQISVMGTITSVSDIYFLEFKNEKDPTNISVKRAKSIQLEDTETLNENDRLDVVLYDDMTNNVTAGETVQITGNMKIEEKNKKSKKRFNVLHATSIEYLNRKEVSVTEEDIKSFQKFVTYPNLLGRLEIMFAPNIIGNKKIKRGLLRSIVGAVKRDKISGGRVGTLEVGDPGTAKSALGTDATEIKPNSRHVSAPHATTKTITAIVEKINESISLSLGAIPLSKGGICSIDEINTFSMEDQSRLLDIMQDGLIYLDKFGKRYTIPAPTTIVATLNPAGGKWDDPNVANTEEFKLKRSLVDRFSQIYTTRDNMNKEQIDDFISKMDDINKRRPYNYNFLRKYLIHASSIKDVTFTNDARGLLNKYWKTGKLKNSLTIRMYKSLYKIAEAQAKLQLKNIVDEVIALQTIDDFDDMMKQYDKAVGTILGPQEVAYKICLDILKESDAGMTIEEMCRIAIHRDNQVLNYLGYIWHMEHNHKVKDLVDALLNNPNIKKIQRKPIVLQWIADSAEVLSDPSDPSDAKTENKNNENIKNITNDILGTENIDHESPSDTSDKSDRNIETDVSEYIQLKGTQQGSKIIYNIEPTVGDLSIQNNFIGGHLRMRGEGGGRYPTNYLEFIDKAFDSAPNTIEVCSNEIQGLNKGGNCFTVDINPEYKPDLVADGQILEGVADNSFSRWRSDPPYNEKTAKEMYGTELPNVIKLLKAGARVVKPGSLMFLLCSQNVQSGAIGKGNIKRIGFINISVVPNNETRILNIYAKLQEEKT
jgi:hypothetical protein